MLDFLQIAMKSPNRKTIEIYPKFMVQKTNDLMIRGSDFYAVWDEESHLWRTDEFDLINLVDRELNEYYKKHEGEYGESYVSIKYMHDSDSGSIDRWHKYCQRQMRDNYHMLDEKLIFGNTDLKKTDYASKQLPYPLEPCDISNYDAIMSVLYSPEERKKLEWAIGSIITGDSKRIQKFEVLYGAAGTGKSTVLNIIQMLFDGYFCTFDSKALGSANAAFALEPFKTNPLVAIQHDGDLSRIEDNTRLNSLVSHEIMTVNEKFKSTYENRFKCFLFMGTNRPVRITDAKSGLIRRLIDVSPTGNKLAFRDYKRYMKGIPFELGGIACHCRDVYLEDPDIYNNYIPINMLGASNDFYNFVEDSYDFFKEYDGVTLKQAWERYKTYCEDARVNYPYNKRAFKEELKNYFRNFEERKNLPDGSSAYNYYEGFKFNLSETKVIEKNEENWLDFVESESIFDILCKDNPAQYATADEIPSKKWANCTTKLSDLNTSKLHYVKLPTEHIVIDFDIPDSSGGKCLALNLKEARKWPPTYAELSKSGQGIHLHYLYDGDPSLLSSVYDDHIEIKVYGGNKALRRKLTKCNSLPINHIASGLPLRKETQVVNFEGLKNEKALRTTIKRCLNKEYDSMPSTVQNIKFIDKILTDAYNSDMHYDVSDLRKAIYPFAAGSTNHATECMKIVNNMKFMSKEPSEPFDEQFADENPVFFDVEVFPNLFLLNWKFAGEYKPMHRVINPKPQDIEDLVQFKLIGYNCRRYDNHILYACMIGYNNEQLYRLSQDIINDKRGGAFFAEAYNISYTDIYDFATKKQSLKKWEIELGLTHKELGLPWDEPVPEDKWDLVAEYCDNDVISTEAVWNHLQADFKAREILADISGLTVNDTTNSHTTKIIFGDNRRPQDQFNYRFLGDKPRVGFTYVEAREYALGLAPKPKGIPYFPGYTYVNGVSTYRGEIIGEGGRVYANPGMYGYSITKDVASMHPHSILAENLFGDEYTDRFRDLVNIRVAIKHGDFDKAKKMFGGRLAKYLDDPSQAKALADALKIAINSVYGLTSAKFDNAFRDHRNIDNIVAKRGALFMTDLVNEVEALGYTVIHVKTDSIKVLNPTKEILDFIQKFGEVYGYEFETEDEWDRICLVNDAVYVGKTTSGEWKATGTQFQVPYVFKQLFSDEPITVQDMCETKSVSKGYIYLDMNEDMPDTSGWEKDLKDIDKQMKEVVKDGVIIDQAIYNDLMDERNDIYSKIAPYHDYRFIGKVGRFCPMNPGAGGGVLYRYDNGKFAAVTGTKGYRWLESDDVISRNLVDDINHDYYLKLVAEALDTLNKFGDADSFRHNAVFQPPDFMNPPLPDELPFDPD